ncbi:MAG TPA: hypothetical protein VLK89_08825 [Solirubrobacterales bacterium]|nr:hypothetical protein [Solirubrobacterales bacterium]
MRSASRHISRVGVLTVCGLLLAGALAGCSTTQEKAAHQQARAKHILDAREKRQQQRSKSDDHGSGKR